MTQPPIRGHTKSGRPITDQDVEALAPKQRLATTQMR